MAPRCPASHGLNRSLPRSASAPGRSAGAEALTTLPAISVALYDATLDDVPDLPTRPIDELTRWASAANEHSANSAYAAGPGPGRVAHRAARPSRHRIRGDDGHLRMSWLGARHRAQRDGVSALDVIEGAADPTVAEPAAAEAAGMLHLSAAQRAAKASS